MRKYTLRASIVFGLVLGIGITQDGFSQSWKLNEKESYVVFIAKNLGMKVSGKISGMKVTSNYEGKDIYASNFTGSIDVTTIDTQIQLRDNHLKSSDYFDVNKYPVIVFKSKQIVAEGYSLKIIGDITIKEVTKEIGMTLTIQKNGNKHTFVGNVTIQRRDFELGSSATVIMADTIVVRILAVFEET